jgi:hypothetical protein
LFILTAIVAVGCCVPSIHKRMLVGRAAQLMFSFLKANRDGDENRAIALTSHAARAKAAKDDIPICGAASETASFTVDRVELIAAASTTGWDAHVSCTWTDLDDDGEPLADKIVFVLRRDSWDWRVDGIVEEEPRIIYWDGDATNRASPPNR